MEEQVVLSLPAEVAVIAENVSLEKRAEVQIVLNQVFDGVSRMRQQLETVIVSDENDKTNMKLANTIRLGVRQVRLDAEKVFDAKRADVQQQMLSYKTEDSLWLKAKQTMQILTKEIEEQARWKEETRQRYEAEQKELKIQQRIALVSRFLPDPNRADFENMGDEMFSVFLSGIEKQYNERIEAERLAELQRIEAARIEAEEREKMRVENERLRIEAEIQAAELAKEKARAEQQRREMEEKARIEREEADKIIRIEQENARKLAAEIEAKKQAEIEEANAKAEAEKKAAAAPDKEKLSELADAIDAIKLPNLTSDEATAILLDVAKLLGKVSTFIRTKSETL